MAILTQRHRSVRDRHRAFINSRPERRARPLVRMLFPRCNGHGRNLAFILDYRGDA